MQMSKVEGIKWLIKFLRLDILDPFCSLVDTNNNNSILNIFFTNIEKIIDNANKDETGIIQNPNN